MRKENIMDVIIKDLDGNYYDINCLHVEGNDHVTIVIKRKEQEYKRCVSLDWKHTSDRISDKIKGEKIL